MNWLRKLFHIHRWEEFDSGQWFSFLPTMKCRKCGVISRYYGPRLGWRVEK